MANLEDIVAGARALVVQARADVDASSVCSSSAFGDDSACAAQHHLVDQLAALVDRLDEQAQAGINNADDLKKFRDLCAVVKQEAASLINDTHAAPTWGKLVDETLADVGSDLGAAAAAVGTAAGDVAGGLFTGLGPVWTLVIFGVGYLLLREHA